MKGGVLVRSLVDRLGAAGYETDVVSVPFKWYPRDEILPHAAAWRLLDLSESAGRPIDLVIATEFPSYFVRHPNKVVWLTRQYRAAYDLCGAEHSDLAHPDQDVGLRGRMDALDHEMLCECRGRYTISADTAERLQRFNGLAAEPLHHPPALADRLRHESYGSYVLSVGRLEPINRVELAIDAMRHADAPLRLVIAGTGTAAETLRERAAEAGVADRIEFLGRVDDETLIELYANALAVVCPPLAEGGYSYVTLEAFLARKPIVTASDSGGPLEFVEHDVSGVICDPNAEAFAAAFNALGDKAHARALGDAGHERARAVTWEAVIETLVDGEAVHAGCSQAGGRA